MSGPRTVLLTGVGGFIGRVTARRLLEAGHAVVGSDVAPPAGLEGLAAFAATDLSRPDSADALARLPDVDAVVHAGGVSGFMVARDDPQLIVDTNVGGTARVLDLARRRGVRRVVFLSTIMVYGPGNRETDPVGEDVRPRPVSTYGASKVAGEALAEAFSAETGADVVSLRLSHVYGAGRTTECMVREMVRAALAGRPVSLPAPADQERQYVHVDDVVDAMTAALERPASGAHVLNVSGGERHRLAEVHAIVADTVGPVEVAFAAGPGPEAYRVPRLSIEGARERLGYAPRIRLQEGVRRLAAELAAG